MEETVIHQLPPSDRSPQVGESSEEWSDTRRGYGHEQEGRKGRTVLVDVSITYTEEGED